MDHGPPLAGVAGAARLAGAAGAGEAGAMATTRKAAAALGEDDALARHGLERTEWGDCMLWRSEGGGGEGQACQSEAGA